MSRPGWASAVRRNPPGPPKGTRHEFSEPTPLNAGRINQRAVAMTATDSWQVATPTRRSCRTAT